MQKKKRKKKENKKNKKESKSTHLKIIEPFLNQAKVIANQ